MYHFLLEGIDEAADSAGVNIQDFYARPFIIAQVDISAEADPVGTVKVQGRVSSDFDWIDIHTFTSSGAQQVTAFPQMRFSATVIEEGTTIDAALAG